MVKTEKTRQKKEKYIFLEELTEEQLNARLEQGMAEYAAGKVCGAQAVRERMKREFGA